MLKGLGGQQSGGTHERPQPNDNLFANVPELHNGIVGDATFALLQKQILVLRRIFETPSLQQFFLLVIGTLIIQIQSQGNMEGSSPFLKDLSDNISV